jgi:predicted solute-binding protein
VVIKHRNSIETWNSLPLPLGVGAVSYNFTSANSQAFGNNMKQISGKSVIYAGDVNQDGIVDSGDMNAVDNGVAAFAQGYLSTDVNGDGIIDSGDMIMLENNSTLFIGKITP